MAKKRRRKSGFQAIPFLAELDLNALADNTVLKLDVITFGEDFYEISADCMWSLEGTAGEGPVSVGFAHGDLSVAEILECLNAEITDPDDIIARERARRPVRKAGTFSGVGTNEVLNNGNPKRTKLKYSVGDGHTFTMFAHNKSGAALAAGTNLHADGVLYGRWQR